MNHIERMQACLSGERPDRPPVALWRHFPVDDQSADGLAAATLDFQRTYDFDLVKVTPASSYCLKDWGIQDEWRGHTEGTRVYTNAVINHPDDWGRLAIRDPRRGYLGEILTSLRMLVQALGGETPVIHTIFNPLSQAKNLVGGERLLIHLRKYPDALHAGLCTIAESTRLFIEEVRRTGVAGIFYAVQHAQYGLLSEVEYETFGRTYDQRVLQDLPGSSDLWLNMLHLHGEDVMFDCFLDYPFQIINWHDQDTPPSLSEAQTRFRGMVCGGLRREATMVLGTPQEVREEAQRAMQATQGRRFLLGTGCVLPIIAPRANILAARMSVEDWVDDLG